MGAENGAYSGKQREEVPAESWSGQNLKPMDILKTMSSPWSALEKISSLRAIPAVWRRLLGEEFVVFKEAFLQNLADPAKGIFCDKCYCIHEVIPRSDVPNSAFRTPHSAPATAAACRCEDRTCPDIPLSPADIEQWSLNWPKFARVLCRTLSLNSRFTDLKLFNTFQIGTWSADAVPVILTIQSSISHLQSAICQLSTRLRRAYILFSPTTENLNATSQEFLASAGAGFFALESTVRLTDSGALLALKTPGELFAKFSPEPAGDGGEDVARKTLALAKSLDAETRFRKAPLYTVFLLYCQEGLAPEEIARKCRCARSIVFTRLDFLRKKLGGNLAALRQHSDHFERIENSLADSRARRIYRSGALYGEDDESSGD